MNFALTVIATVVSGTTVFVIGQVIVVLFLERIRTQARCIEDVAQALTLYRPLYLEALADDGHVRRVTASPAIHYPPGSERIKTDERIAADAASVELRRLGSLLMANSQTIRLYGLWRFIRLVFPKSWILGVSRELIMLSQVCPPANEAQVESAAIHERELKQLLKIEVN
ncbi:MAG: hypothetical protein O2913_11885 [Chloroflexi bacterium]|nr:hypothetical protein [Chloroflexota bacterium]